MVHKSRKFSVCLSTPEETAEKLVNHSWTLCSAFYVNVPGETDRGIYLVNDSFSEDSAQEYAVFRANPGSAELEQIESLTVSWYESPEKLLATILDLLNNPARAEHMGRTNIKTHSRGEYCSHCA